MNGGVSFAWSNNLDRRPPSPACSTHIHTNNAFIHSYLSGLARGDCTSATVGPALVGGGSSPRSSSATGSSSARIMRRRICVFVGCDYGMDSVRRWVHRACVCRGGSSPTMMGLQFNQVSSCLGVR